MAMKWIVLPLAFPLANQVKQHDRSWEEERKGARAGEGGRGGRGQVIHAGQAVPDDHDAGAGDRGPGQDQGSALVQVVQAQTRGES